jgi:hypothetical protein
MTIIHHQKTIRDYHGSYYFIFLKKHSCSKCNIKLKRKENETFVNSYCKKGKKRIIFPGIEGFTIRVITYYFHCSKCKADYTIDELKAK